MAITLPYKHFTYNSYNTSQSLKQKVCNSREVVHLEQIDERYFDNEGERRGCQVFISRNLMS